MLKKYIFNNLLALDRLGNALSGGDSRETISSRGGKNPRCSFVAAGLHRILNWLDPGHTDNAIRHEEKEIGKNNVF